MTLTLTPPRLRSTLPASDIPGFFTAVNEAFQEFVKAVQYPGAVPPEFCESFPRERILKQDDDFNVITYRVKSSMMAPTDNSGARVPREPQLREKVQEPGVKNYLLTTKAWTEFVEVEFSIWANGNTEADITTNWFHKFLMYYAFTLRYFQANGVQIFKFVERMDDDIDHTQEQEVYRRRLVYSFRLETLTQLESRNLTSLTVSIGPTDTSEVQIIELGE